MSRLSGQDDEVLAAQLGLLAGVRAPWRVSQHVLDEGSRSLHLWLTQAPAAPQPTQRGWFGWRSVRLAPRRALPDGHVWRHLDCMGFVCFVHTSDALYDDAAQVDWLGPQQLPFTHGLSRKVFTLLAEGLELPVICEVLRLPFADVWKFKFALDNGQLSMAMGTARRARPPAYTANASLNAAAADRPARQAPGATPSAAPWLNPREEDAIVVVDDGVPHLADPVWERLISGELVIQIKTLGFQLLLTKLRQQVSLQQSDEVKIMKLQELHRYVTRHERSLAHELQQLHHHADGRSS